MSRPIFLATHPRACSTAFERIFMTRRDILKCVHEPFGDAFYFGPERLSERYENDEKEREQSGFSQSTYKTVMDRLDREAAEGNRLFIKDITHYLVPPNGKPTSIAPSLVPPKKGVRTGDAVEANGIADGHAYPYSTEPEPNNPTVVPKSMLAKFHFTFLIRHPRSSIPSYYRCTIPPLDAVTGFYNFMPSEAGYDELRRVFDYLRNEGLIGPTLAGKSGEINGSTAYNGGDVTSTTAVDICVIDADDLLDNPAGIIKAYCKSVGVPFEPAMLTWDTPEDHEIARAAFEKWKGFHEDAIHSVSLRPRIHSKKPKSREEEDREWVEKYGDEGARIIRETADNNLADYEHLKQFALKA